MQISAFICYKPPCLIGCQFPFIEISFLVKLSKETVCALLTNLRDNNIEPN